MSRWASAPIPCGAEGGRTFPASGPEPRGFRAAVPPARLGAGGRLGPPHGRPPLTPETFSQPGDIDLAAWQPTQAARLLHACRPEAGNLSTQGHSLESGTSSQRRPLPSATFSQTGHTWPGCLATRRGCVSLESGTPGLRISRLLSNRGGNVHIETLNAPVACPETAFPSPERYVIWLTPDRGPGSNHLHKVL